MLRHLNVFFQGGCSPGRKPESSGARPAPSLENPSEHPPECADQPLQASPSGRPGRWRLDRRGGGREPGISVRTVRKWLGDRSSANEREPSSCIPAI